MANPWAQREGGFNNRTHDAELTKHSYDSLRDRNLRHFYENPRVQRQLIGKGLVSRQSLAIARSAPLALESSTSRLYHPISLPGQSFARYLEPMATPGPPSPSFCLVLTSSFVAHRAAHSADRQGGPHYQRGQMQISGGDHRARVQKRRTGRDCSAKGAAGSSSELFFRSD